MTRIEFEAACWRALCLRMRLRMSPMTSPWKIVETSPMYGDEKDVSDWIRQIENLVKGDK